MTQSRVGRGSGGRRRLMAGAILAGMLAAVGLVGPAPQPAIAAGGNFDPGFAVNGVFYAPLALGILRGGNAVALQKDGKIVVAGYQANEAATEKDLVLWRLTQGGVLDATFNGGGFARLALPGYQEAFAVAIDKLGRIVVAGSTSAAAGSDFLVARFTSNGILDPSFNGTGVVTRGFGAGSSDTAYGVAIQKDGKIVAAGDTGINSEEDFALARLLPTGTPDPNFGGGDGLVVTNFGGDDGAFALALQKDGKIVLAGQSRTTANYDFALARYLRDGSTDLSFGGGDGLVTTDFGDDYAAAVAVQSDGRIVAAGQADVGGVNSFALARYQKNGSPDLSFDTDGKIMTTFNGKDYAAGLSIQKDGKLVAVGGTRVGTDNHFALARYQKDGNLDPNFGLAGRLVPFSPGSGANAVAIQKDGKLVVAGSSGPTMLVARLLAR